MCASELQGKCKTAAAVPKELTLKQPKADVMSERARI